MKISFSWLKSYIVEDISFEEVSLNLSKLGFGIDLIKKTKLETEKVYTAKILKIEKHPNADKLSLCEVSTGENNFKVVCGAKNIYEGQIVPLALIGAKLGNEELKKAKIRGVESNGMICSAQELGLEEASEGILELDKDLTLGKDIKEIFPEGDYVFELEITPNLSYCLSHYSLARELAIFKGYTLKDFKTNNYSALKQDIKIEIENSKNCYRYIGLVVKNIKNKKTPEEIYSKLKAIGVNPKDDILIDVTNYVMFELGQPTHCFDLKNIEGSKVNIRQALLGEKIKLLDGSLKELDPKIMVIADEKKPIAIAGLMGGFYSSIQENTKDIFIEVANFNPSIVRKASSFLNIKSDSSYRFERGIDPDLQLKTAFRILDIILSQNEDAIVEQITDKEVLKIENPFIKIDYQKINSILGKNLENEKIKETLSNISNEFDGVNFKAPSYRLDIKNIYDVSEEVARFLGYDIIEEKTSMPVMKAKDNPLKLTQDYFRNKLTSLGFNEVCNYDLISLKDVKDIIKDEQTLVEIQNPLSLEFNYLRPSLLSGLLKNLKYNLNHGINSLMIYEIGKTFNLNSNKIIEKDILSGLIFGNNFEEFWRKEENNKDFYYLKGIINLILKDILDFSFVKESNVNIFEENTFLNVKNNKDIVSTFGLLSPNIKNNWDLKENVYYFEIDLSYIKNYFAKDFYNRIKKAKIISQYQHSKRDLSIVIDNKYLWQDIEKEIKNTKDLLSVDLIDIYSGKNIPEGKRSLTLRFVFSSMEKTFIDEDLNKYIEEIFIKLQKKFSVEIRK